MSSNQNSN